MKKTFLILTTVVLCVLSSCEKEQDRLSEKEIANYISDLPMNRGGGGDDDCCHEENMFERQLHWFSATTSRVLQFHPGARNEVTTELNSTFLTTISAETLLGSGTSLTSFESAFIQEFSYYLNPADPNTDIARPTFPPNPSGAPGNMSNLEIYNIYKDILLEENCVELYFPLGLDLRSPFNTTSTAHPLTTSSANEGILRVHSLVSSGEVGDEPPTGSLSSFVVVDNTYLNHEENIIVARPFVNSIGGPNDPLCDYTEYNGIDFTDFLD